MGEQRVKLPSEKVMQRFIINLLKDIEALEHMLDNDWFENDVVRIGAEQEMALVDKKHFRPMNVAMPALEKMKKYDWIETELAQFNLETNLQPHIFKNNCLSQLEAEINNNLKITREVLNTFDAELILTGILPTFRKQDLSLVNLTPKPRYRALMDSINAQLTGNLYELRLRGIDEILVNHDSPMLEACNTSFQVHLQVSSNEFVKMHNIAQTLAAPTMAFAANSPIVFGKRLWHESRIALFQQALDIRTTRDHMRERSPRVSFGTDWLDNSVLDIYKDDIARFRVLIAGEKEEDSLELIRKGKVPKLRALQVHNSTVYRWNRPCYGISENGKPHLRIENRVIPAGPTVIDEVANAAFWLGAMKGIAKNYDDIRDVISWPDVRDNFEKAARFGIDSNFTWFNDTKISACDLVLKELLPLAKEGLESQQVDKNDISRYLDIIEERAKRHMNGARWQLRAYSHLRELTGQAEALTVLTASMLENQKKEIPVHEWELPKIEELEPFLPVVLKVDEFMQTDLLTVREDDLIEMVAKLMEWRHIRHMAIEDEHGNFVGLITSKELLGYYATCNIQKDSLKRKDVVAIDIMAKNVPTIHPDASIAEAMEKMRQTHIGCLPVTQDGELIGMITETDFLSITGRLIEHGG